MFAEVAGVEHADVVYGDDGRSRVRVLACFKLD